MKVSKQRAPLNLASDQTADLGRMVSAWISEDAVLCRLKAFLGRTFPAPCRLFLVGGVLRDLCISRALRPKDIDVMVVGIESVQLRALPDANLNYFGGTTFWFEGLPVDIWPLMETYHIRHFDLPRDVHGLLSGAPFNLDKIALDLTSGCLHDGGCLQGVIDHLIAYEPAKPYLEHIQAARCVLLEAKTGFALDETARSLLARAWKGLLEEQNGRAEIAAYLNASRAPETVGEIINRVEELAAGQPRR